MVKNLQYRKILKLKKKKEKNDYIYFEIPVEW